MHQHLGDVYDTVEEQMERLFADDDSESDTSIWTDENRTPPLQIRNSQVPTPSTESAEGVEEQMEKMFAEDDSESDTSTLPWTDESSRTPLPEIRNSQVSPSKKGIDPFPTRKSFVYEAKPKTCKRNGKTEKRPTSCQTPSRSATERTTSHNSAPLNLSSGSRQEQTVRKPRLVSESRANASSNATGRDSCDDIAEVDKHIDKFDALFAAGEVDKENKVRLPVRVDMLHF